MIYVVTEIFVLPCRRIGSKAVFKYKVKFHNAILRKFAPRSSLRKAFQIDVIDTAFSILVAVYIYQQFPYLRKLKRLAIACQISPILARQTLAKYVIKPRCFV